MTIAYQEILTDTTKRSLPTGPVSGLWAGGGGMQLDPSKNAMQKNAKKMQKNAKKNAKKSATYKEIPL